MNKGAFIFGAVLFVFAATLVFLFQDATQTLNRADNETVSSPPVSVPIPAEPAPQIPQVSEREINVCQVDEDCIVVPYHHCCGAIKRAINKKWLDAYKASSTLQKFDNPSLCAIIGKCADDSNVTSSACVSDSAGLHCQLKL